MSESKQTIDNWPGDILQRKEVADFLTEYMVNRYKESKTNADFETLTLNINSEWGGGKTFLLTNWQQQLTNSIPKHPCVYFDAWKTDYSKDPLIAFISEINEQLSDFMYKSEKNKQLLRKTYDLGKKLVKPSAATVIAALTKLSLDEANEMLSDSDTDEKSENDDSHELVSTVISKAAEQALNRHKTIQETIEEFNQSLAFLIKKIGARKNYSLPLFIFIDELDRCRPSYAIELLENIKHLFRIKGVYFVIATDSEQLCSAIRSIYGEKFDSPRYLKRFFDQEYLLPDPSYLDFSRHSYHKYRLDNYRNIFTYFDNNEETKNKSIEIISKLAEMFKLTPRDIDQCYSVLKAIALTWKNDRDIHLIYMMYLIMVKHRYPYDLFQNYLNDGEKPKENSLMEIIHNIVRLPTITSNFVEFNQREHYETRPFELPMSDIIREYISLSNRLPAHISENEKTGKTIIDSIRKKSIEDSCKGPQIKQGSNFLTEYPHIVAKAGNLHI